MLKKPGIDDWSNINRTICYIAESGIHTSGEVARTIENKLSYSAELVHDTVKRIFLDLAEVHFACVQLLEGECRDYVLTPIVNPHRFAGLMDMPVGNRNGPRPAVGEIVNFAVWDGNNAPADLNEWQGSIIERRHNGFFTKYIIVRTADQQKIKLDRQYILRRANSKEKPIKAWSFEDLFTLNGLR